MEKLKRLVADAAFFFFVKHSHLFDHLSCHREQCVGEKDHLALV